MSFYVGQKVVCIQDDWDRVCYPNEICPQKGAVYTVRAITVACNIEGLQLYEIVNEPREYYHGIDECSFNSIHFRPLTERKTDISIFTKMLKEVEAAQ